MDPTQNQDPTVQPAPTAGVPGAVPQTPVVTPPVVEEPVVTPEPKVPAVPPVVTPTEGTDNPGMPTGTPTGTI